MMMIIIDYYNIIYTSILAINDSINTKYFHKEIKIIQLYNYKSVWKPEKNYNNSAWGAKTKNWYTIRVYQKT